MESENNLTQSDRPQQRPPASGLAIASLVCGILAVFTSGATCLPAIICGHMALSRIKRSPHSYGGRGLAITGLLFGYLLPISMMIIAGAYITYRRANETTKTNQAKTEMKSFGSPLEMYRLNAGHYPTTTQGLRALVTKPTSTPIPRRWAKTMESIPLDPWGNEYRYRFPGKNDSSKYDIISNGADGAECTDDDIISEEL